MDFWGQVWKRVWEMAFVGLKLGLDFEMRAAHPHQNFQGVPPTRAWVTDKAIAWESFTRCTSKLNFASLADDPSKTTF